MKHLALNDKVLTSTGDFQTVYAFGHYQTEHIAGFIQIYTDGSKKDPLEVTPEHLLFLKDHSNPIRADSIKVGDELKGLDKTKVVSKLAHVQKQGLYAPFTPDGTLVVNGLKVSAYVSLQDSAKEYLELQGGAQLFLSQHQYVHIALSPFRLFCMGVSSTSVCTHYDENGLPHFVAFGIKLNEWVHSFQSKVVQALAYLVILIATGACFGIEMVFGPRFAPTAIVVLVGMFSIWKMLSKKFYISKVKTA